MTAASELMYREGIPDPAHRAAIHRLLRDIFDVDVSPIDELGLAEPTYRAFSYLDRTGFCVANAATFDLKLIIDGRRVDAVGIQSVATRPEWRRRGLSHALLQIALAWCDATARPSFLMTSIPDFYQPMGFRIVPQSAWIGIAPVIAGPLAPRCRRLDLAVDDDRRLLARTLRHRVPVSTRFAVDGSPGSCMLALLGQTGLTAWYMAQRQAIIVTAEHSAAVLCLVDVVAAVIPPLEAIVAAFEQRPRQVEVHFPPDRLAWHGTAIPAPTPMVLMVRGDVALRYPCMIPETAEF